MESLLFTFFVPGSVFGYPVLQFLAWRKFSRGWWYASLGPLILMGPAVVITVIGFSAQSNLWPLVYIFASMASVAYLLLLWGLRWVVQQATA